GASTKNSTAVRQYGDARFWPFGVPGEPKVRWGDLKFARLTALCLVTPQCSVTHAGTFAEKANALAGMK
ncbi:MAG: hypothetical protein IJL41_03085, partial [Clostridia bacterium]|nr:hypothetical protein [Clostridia bacterium]